MYKSVKSVRDCQELQQDLIQLQAWQERFNPRKCNIMRATHATRKKIEFPYTLDDTPLADTPSTSYLGVELSSDLRWNKQVKKTVASSACPGLDSDCELVWAKIELLGARNLYVGAYYRTPSANNTLLGLEQSLQKLRNSNSVVWLGGDFNLPNIDWEDNAVKPDTQQVGLGNSLLDICSDMGLTQMNNQPTRKENILDLYLTNSPTLVRHRSHHHSHMYTARTAAEG